MREKERQRGGEGEKREWEGNAYIHTNADVSLHQHTMTKRPQHALLRSQRKQTNSVPLRQIRQLFSLSFRLSRLRSIFSIHGHSLSFPFPLICCIFSPSATSCSYTSHVLSRRLNCDSIVRDKERESQNRQSTKKQEVNKKERQPTRTRVKQIDQLLPRGWRPRQRTAYRLCDSRPCSTAACEMHE